MQRGAILRHQLRFTVARDLEFERVWLALQRLREDPAQQTPRGKVAASGDGVGEPRRAGRFFGAGRRDGLAFGCAEILEAYQPKIHADPCG